MYCPRLTVKTYTQNRRLWMMLLLIMQALMFVNSASISPSESKVGFDKIQMGKQCLIVQFLGTIKFVHDNTLLTQYDINHEFAVQKTSVPTDDGVFFSVRNMRQIMFYDVPYEINFEVTIIHVDRDGIEFGVQQQNESIDILFIQYLVVDPSYIDAPCFEHQEFNVLQTHLFTFSNGNNATFPNKVAIFISRLRIQPIGWAVQSTSMGTVYGVHINEINNLNNYGVSIRYGDGSLITSPYNQFQMKVQVLILYTGLLHDISKYQFFDNYIVQSYKENRTSAETGLEQEWDVGSETYSGFIPNNTTFLLGLTKFQRKTTTSIFSYWLENTNEEIFIRSLTLETAQYRMFGFNVYDFKCSNPLFPIERTQTNGSVLCHDSCFDGEYLSFSTAEDKYICALCPDHCTKCLRESNCTQCEAHYELVVTDSPDSQQTCSFNNSYYLMADSSVSLCSTAIQNCSKCLSGTQCTQCDTGFLLNASDHSCFQCSEHIQGCIECNQTHCHSCSSDYTLVSITECILNSEMPQPQNPTDPFRQPQACTDYVNCEYCREGFPDQCLECFNEDMTVVDGECLMICGDSVLDSWSEECDDGNTDNFDGCSAECQLESDIERFMCENVVNLNNGKLMTQCLLNSPVFLELKSLRKNQKDNKLQIQLSLSEPAIKEWENVSDFALLNQMFSISISEGSVYSLENKKFRFSHHSNGKNSTETNSGNSRRLLSESDLSQYEQRMEDSFGTIQLQTDCIADSTHYESLNHQTMRLTFDPRSSQYSVFANTAATNLSFALVADNNQILQYYDAEYYGFYSFVKYAAYLVTALTYAMLIASIVFGAVEKGNGASLMVLEFCGVPQLLFAYLAVAGEFNPLMAALAEGLQFINGVPTDFLVFDSETETLSRQLAAVGYSSPHVADNSAAVVCVLSLILVVGLALKVVVWRMTVRQQQLSANKPQKYAQNEQNVEQAANDGQRDNEWTAIESLESKANFLLINVGFVLLMFFSYGLMINLCVQIIYAESFHMLDFVTLGMTVVIYVVYILLFFMNPSIYSLFLYKIKKLLSNRSSLNAVPHSQSHTISEQHCFCTQFSIINSRIYWILLFGQKLLNGSLVLVLSCFIYQNVLPLAIYCGLAVFFYRRQFYTFSQNIRVTIVFAVGCTVQSLLLYRKVTVYDKLSLESVGAVEDFTNQYIALTTIITIFLCLICTFSYVAYSFKRVRCCLLEIEKPKMVTAESIHKNLRKATIDISDSDVLNTEESQKCSVNQKILQQKQYTSINDGKKLIEENRIVKKEEGKSQKVAFQKMIKKELKSKVYWLQNSSSSTKQSPIKRSIPLQEQQNEKSQNYYHNIEGDIYLLEEEFNKI